MNCLILAAGYGSRLRPLSESKPLAPVLGRPLIEHVICRAAEGGATRFTVVTGHKAERVEAFLRDFAERLRLPVETVRLDDWSRPNGLSVVAGAERIDGDYLLLMTDHLFDPELARRLLQSPTNDGLRLAIDRNLANPLTDLDDATKVETAPDGSVVRIGKSLEHYDAIDTGLFVATPALRKAILEAVADGRSGSLSDGVQRLADQGLAATMDIGESWWLDVDDPPSHALAEAHLRDRPAKVRDNAA
jgi:1L-myo-inositol 1-phosphate cytidylyltransferase